MMKRLFAAVILTTCVSGCYRLTTEVADSQDRIYFSEIDGDQVDSFHETESIAFGFWGLTTFKEANPQNCFDNYLQKGAKISNLRIKTEQTFVDSLIGSLTWGIYNPYTIHYEGDVVRPRGKK